MSRRGNAAREGGRHGYSFESRGMWGKERGYNLGISGGNFRGEGPSESRQVEFIFLCNHPKRGMHEHGWLNHSWHASHVQKFFALELIIEYTQLIEENIL